MMLFGKWVPFNSFEMTLNKLHIGDWQGNFKLKNIEKKIQDEILYN